VSDGNYSDFGRDSLFAQIDVRAKLSCVASLTTITLLWDRPLFQGILVVVVFFLCLLGSVAGSYLKSIFRIMLPFYLILLFTHGFFNVQYVKSLTGQAELTTLWRVPSDIWGIGGARLTQEGMLFGLNACLKTVVLTLVAPLLIFTTSVDSLIAGLVRARVPYKLAFILSATLRFFPMLLADVRAIIDAQRMRGLSVERMGLLGRIRVYARLAVPLILGAMTKSQQLEVVLQSKAFSGARDRTYLHDTHLRVADYCMIGVSAVAAVAAIALYVLFGVGRFTGSL